jgi:hypothetical protein
VLWTWNCHVLRIYWLSTGSFVPSDSAFVYDWIDDTHGDSWSDQGVKESEWLTDQSYQDVSEEPIK